MDVESWGEGIHLLGEWNYYEEDESREIAKKISRIDNSEIKTPFAQNRIEYILAKIAEVVRRE